MRKPRAQIIDPKSQPVPKEKTAPPTGKRTPRAFAPTEANIQNISLESWTDPPDTQSIAPATTKQSSWILKLALWAGGLLVSLGVALIADQLIRDLFARYDWLGWLGSIALILFVFAIIVLFARELLAMRSLKNLDNLRNQTQAALNSDMPEKARAILARLHQVYHPRADLAKAKQELNSDLANIIDGAAMIHAAERRLMAPLDARAKTLTAASAKRVAIVTAISPRAIVDIAFVAFESMKLARAIATLYGAKPGLFGSWRLAREILAHLALTGGVALGDSVVQQLLGHGLAAKLSARLGEGLVNGLMSVRVGLAAMRVTRPMPFDRLKQPQVMDFMTDLANITKGETK